MRARCWKLWNYLSGKGISTGSLPTVTVILHRGDLKVHPSLPLCVANQNDTLLRFCCMRPEFTWCCMHLLRSVLHPLREGCVPVCITSHSVNSERKRRRTHLWTFSAHVQFWCILLLLRLKAPRTRKAVSCRLWFIVLLSVNLWVL